MTVNYIPTGPWTNGSSPGISASFLNAIEAILKQPSGGGESGKYFVGAGAYTTTAVVGQYISSLSRTAVPVSLTIDSSDATPPGGATLSTAHLTQSGFQVYINAAATNANAFYGGTYTINF